MLSVGIVFIVTAVFIFFFKHENNATKGFSLKVMSKIMKQSDEPATAKTSVLSTYKVILNILKLVPVKKLGFLLLTLKVGLITSSVIFLKLIENGVKKEVQTLFGSKLGLFVTLQFK